MYPHRLIFLNPSHTSSNTPIIIKDWMDLISESIKNPKSPNINLSNPAIQKAAILADVSNMPESVLEDAKKAEAGKKTISIYEDMAKQEERRNIAKKMKGNYWHTSFIITAVVLTGVLHFGDCVGLIGRAKF